MDHGNNQVNDTMAGCRATWGVFAVCATVLALGAAPTVDAATATAGSAAGSAAELSALRVQVQRLQAAVDAEVKKRLQVEAELVAARQSAQQDGVSAECNCTAARDPRDIDPSKASNAGLKDEVEELLAAEAARQRRVSHEDADRSDNGPKEISIFCPKQPNINIVDLSDGDRDNNECLCVCVLLCLSCCVLFTVWMPAPVSLRRCLRVFDVLPPPFLLLGATDSPGHPDAVQCVERRRPGLDVPPRVVLRRHHHRHEHVTAICCTAPRQRRPPPPTLLPLGPLTHTVEYTFVTSKTRFRSVVAHTLPLSRGTNHFPIGDMSSVPRMSIFAASAVRSAVQTPRLCRAVSAASSVASPRRRPVGPSAAPSRRLSSIACAKPDEAIVYFDGSCPLCTKEIRLYDRLQGWLPRRRMQFVNLFDMDAPSAAALEGAGVSVDEALFYIHVLVPDEEATAPPARVAVSGVDAFLAMWERSPVFGVLPPLFYIPGVRQAAAKLYHVWAFKRQKVCSDSACPVERKSAPTS